MTPEPLELDWLRRWALYSPQSLAIKDGDGGEEYSYQRCFHLSQQLAHYLRESHSLKEGDRVAVLATNEIEYVLLFFALQRLGAMMVPINFRLSAREVAHIIDDSEPQLVIFQQAFEPLLTDAMATCLPTWSFDGENGLQATLRSLEHQPAIGLAMAGDFLSPCMILYTSGTTGFPKGAVLTHKTLFWNSVSTGLRLNICSSDRTVIFLPFFHTSGWNVLTMPFLHHGAGVIFLRKFCASLVLKRCESEKATILFGVPTTMDMMARTSEFANCDLTSVRYAIVGGEPMTINAIQAWAHRGIAIRQGYGLTEFGPNVFSLNEADAIRKMGSIGFANFYVDSQIVDDKQQPVDVGEVGELVLRGPACMAGYWRNPSATLQTIRNGWLHTGDLVRCDHEGYYYVVGRKKEMYISGGENVYPVEVEKVLYSLSGVKEAAVIGVADANWGEVGKAFVALEEGVELTLSEVYEHCRKNLAKFKVPKYIEFLSELPKGDSGKILKRQLEAF